LRLVDCGSEPHDRRLNGQVLIADWQLRNRELPVESAIACPIVNLIGHVNRQSATGHFNPQSPIDDPP
jgi:hypothetical protein